ncbi:MAG: hypothetical protein AAF488_00810 [Planctomycetota bacterium]
MKIAAKLGWFTAKIAVVLFAALATAAALFSSDEIASDIDRELFPGCTYTIASVCWIVLLRLLFRRKKILADPSGVSAEEAA